MKKTNKKLNIVIAYQYLSFKGGIEEVIYNQSKLLKELGYGVEILTSKFSENESTLSRDKVKIHRIPSLNVTYKMFGIPFAIPVINLSSIKTLAKVIKNADVVNVHGHPYLFSLFIVVVARLLKKQVILTQHNTNIKSKSVFINTIYTLFDRTMGKYNLARSHKIIAVSGETKNYVTTLTANKAIEVIYNGVDTKRFTPSKSKKTLRFKFGIPQNKFVCFTVRRLTFKNGIETFLDTAKISDQKKTLFLLGGTGPDKEKINQYIKTNNINNIKILGFIEDKNLASYYALSDVFILPSIQGEGFPMVVLESFSSGIPVIATKSGGHTEIIKNGGTGYLVEVNKPLQIKKKVEFLLSNRKIIGEMSQNCREIVVKNLSWTQNIRQLTNTFETWI